MRKKEINLKKDFLNSLKTLKDSKKCIYFGISIFLLMVIIGYFFPKFFVEEIRSLLNQLMLSFENLNTLQIVLKIFLNNALVSLSIILLGIVIGLFPLWATIQNGYIIGFVANKAIALEGIWVLWRLIPHGIFELPAIFIAIGLGLKLGEKVLRRDKPIKFLKDSLKVFLFVIMPLLIVAAIIEGLLIGFVV